jgi:hypothetical protein
MAERPVYSQGFIYYVDGAPNTSFLVPDGFTAVVRQISIVIGFSSSVVSVNVQESATAPAVAICAVELTGAIQQEQGEGRWVVNEGGIISVYQQTLGIDCTIYVGGYLLRN